MSTKNPEITVNESELDAQAQPSPYTEGLNQENVQDIPTTEETA